MLSGAQALRGREAHPHEQRGAIHDSRRRTAGERTSVFAGTHRPSRVVAEKRRPQWSPLFASAHGVHTPRVCTIDRQPGARSSARGSDSPPVRVRRRGARSWFEKGTRVRRKAPRTFARVTLVPRSTLFRKRELSRGSSARPAPQGAVTKAKAQGGSSPPGQHEESMQRVAVPVHRRICRSRQSTFGLREARDRRASASRPFSAASGSEAWSSFESA